MAKPHPFHNAVLGRLLPFGPVAARPMFGGFGLYLDGRMFALIARDRLYFKVDDANRNEYEAAGVEPFQKTRGTKRVSMSYYKVPFDVLAGSAALCDWAERALDAARSQGRRAPQVKEEGKEGGKGGGRRARR